MSVSVVVASKSHLIAIAILAAEPIAKQFRRGSTGHLPTTILHKEFNTVNGDHEFLPAAYEGTLCLDRLERKSANHRNIEARSLG